MNAVTTPNPPPEAQLIEARRQALRPKLSIRAAADRAGISEGRWRQIAKGFQTVSRGMNAPVVAPADTLARMAGAVGLRPEDLAQAGRADAAAELDLIDHRRDYSDASREAFARDVALHQATDAQIATELVNRLADLRRQVSEHARTQEPGTEAERPQHGRESGGAGSPIAPPPAEPTPSERVTMSGRDVSEITRYGGRC